jgi:hydroxymethylbilane synthase
MAAPAPPQPPLRIGTRRSNLAMVQAEQIRNSLQKIAPDRSFEIEALRTLGDKDQTKALYNFDAKSLWTAELEDMLVSGQLDLIVHCLKGEPPFSLLFHQFQHLTRLIIVPRHAHHSARLVRIGRYSYA